MGRKQNRRKDHDSDIRLLTAIISLVTAIITLIIKLIDWLGN